MEFVTPANIQDWVVEGYPIHPAYENLSLVHRSDYLRAYLMHHFGGGYCDLKEPNHSWSHAFERALSDPDVWVTSYGEMTAHAATRIDGPLGFDIAMYHQQLAGTGSMIVRSHTPFTGEWLREVERLMTYFADQMAEFPAVSAVKSWGIRFLGRTCLDAFTNHYN